MLLFTMFMSANLYFFIFWEYGAQSSSHPPVKSSLVFSKNEVCSISFHSIVTYISIYSTYLLFLCTHCLFIWIIEFTHFKQAFWLSYPRIVWILSTLSVWYRLYTWSFRKGCILLRITQQEYSDNKTPLYSLPYFISFTVTPRDRRYLEQTISFCAFGLRLETIDEGDQKFSL